MQTLHIVRMLLLQPVVLRRTMGMPWAQWLMLALTAGFSVWAVLGPLKPAAGLALIVGAGQLVAWWALFVISIGLQHAQRGARLVPQLRRITLATTLLVWLCLVLLIALAAGSLFGHHALWALLAGLALAGVALFVAGRREVIVVFAVGWLLTVGSGPSEAAPILALLETPAGLAGGAALLGASMYTTLRLVLGRPTGEKPDGKFLSMWSHMVRGTPVEQGPLLAPRLYAACLRRDCARRDVANLFMHALGPSLHWSFMLPSLLPGLLLNVALGLALRLQLIPSGHAGIVTAVFIGWMVSSLFLFQMGLARVASRQPEHALLRLAPAMPGSSALNRTLARGLLALFFTHWTACMGGMALVLALADVPQAKFIELMSSMSVSVLLAAGMLRNYAAANQVRDRRLPGRLVLIFLQVLAIQLLPAAMTLLGLPELPAPAMGALATLPVMLLAGLIVWRRWRAMLAAPPAFPVARI